MIKSLPAKNKQINKVKKKYTSWRTHYNLIKLGKKAKAYVYGGVFGILSVVQSFRKTLHLRYLTGF